MFSGTKALVYRTLNLFTKKEYVSNEALFEEIRRIAARLEETGQSAAANELRSGLSCLNGLTDGWTMLMESVDKTLKAYGHVLAESECSDLRTVLRAVRRAVYR